jgi:hypothetical protein
MAKKTQPLEDGQGGGGQGTACYAHLFLDDVLHDVPGVGVGGCLGQAVIQQRQEYWDVACCQPSDVDLANA